MVSPIAETVATTRTSRARASTRRCATCLILSGSATEEPPNFMTTVSLLGSGRTLISWIVASAPLGWRAVDPGVRAGATTKFDYVSGSVLPPRHASPGLNSCGLMKPFLVLSVRLSPTTRAFSLRAAGVVILPGERADRIGVCRALCVLAVPGHLSGERRTPLRPATAAAQKAAASSRFLLMCPPLPWVLTPWRTLLPRGARSIELQLLPVPRKVMLIGLDCAEPSCSSSSAGATSCRRSPG